MGDAPEDRQEEPIARPGEMRISVHGPGWCFFLRLASGDWFCVVKISLEEIMAFVSSCHSPGRITSSIGAHALDRHAEANMLKC